MTETPFDRPYTTVILAMAADGKIADRTRAAARFGSTADRAHLETQIAAVDGVVFGAGTLRAYGTTLRVSSPELLDQRIAQGKAPQPVQIVCSRSANLDPTCGFFLQPVPRWLMTTWEGAELWQGHGGFERILIMETLQHGIDWVTAFQKLPALGLKRLAILGGGQLVASLLAHGLIDEFWLTVCPLILGGVEAPTPVEGPGFLASMAPRLELLSMQVVEQEVFLHYRILKESQTGGA